MKVIELDCLQPRIVVVGHLAPKKQNKELHCFKDTGRSNLASKVYINVYHVAHSFERHHILNHSTSNEDFSVTSSHRLLPLLCFLYCSDVSFNDNFYAWRPCEIQRSGVLQT